MGHSSKAQAPAAADNNLDEPLPTHYVGTVEGGNQDVQLYVSTNSQLYDIKSIKGGSNSFVVVGSWETAALPQLVQALGTRTAIDQSSSGRSGQPGSSGQFNNSYGSGKVLGKAVAPVQMTTSSGGGGGSGSRTKIGRPHNI